MTMLPIPKLETELGRLYEGDSLRMLRDLPSDSVDLAFADPPFNLAKEYSSKMDDSIPESSYLAWCKQWIAEMVRVLKPGGSIFIYNLPKWNIPCGAYLMDLGMTFRHWITIDMKYALPISGRLYPSHYSMLYYVKGPRPNIFHPDRLPIECCKNCGKEQKDYGGYKNKMNPKGINITDVWTDIPPVRHSKYKTRDANELSLKLMDRVLNIASDPDSVVLDPFGGAGTTFIAAEVLGRKWIGMELDCDSILERFTEIEREREFIAAIHSRKNTLFTAQDLVTRRRSGLDSSKYQLDEVKAILKKRGCTPAEAAIPRTGLLPFS